MLFGGPVGGTKGENRSQGWCLHEGISGLIRKGREIEESEQRNSKIYVKTQKTPNSQSSFKREDKATGITHPDFK